MDDMIAALKGESACVEEGRIGFDGQVMEAQDLGTY